MFGFIVKNMEKKKLNIIKLVRTIYILKLFNFYIMKHNNWNKIEETYKNN